MDEYKIRMALTEDSDEILGICAPYIEKTAYTFEYEVPTKEEFKDRVMGIMKSFPYLVCTYNDEIIGYAYASKERDRAAYQWNAELSVYTKMGLDKRGVGKALYSSLIDIVKHQNISTLYAGHISSNEQSRKLHEYFGFTEMATIKAHGFKLGSWHDGVRYQKVIGDKSVAPKPFIPIEMVDPDVIREILTRHSMGLNRHI